MKQAIQLGASAIAAVLLLCGCSDDWGLTNTGAGRIAPLVGIDTQAVAPKASNASSRAETELTAADLSLKLTKNDGSYAQTWAKVADFPLDKQFGVGDYTLEAFYGDANSEGFECPAYFGSQSFTVTDGQTTSLGLTASMSNCRFIIKYTEAFQGYMTDWSATVTGAAAQAYAKDEVRPVYVKPGQVSIEIAFTKPNGLQAKSKLDPVTAQARHEYIVTVDVNEGSVGDATLTVSFDETLNSVVQEIDISDALLTAPVPSILPEGFTPEVPVEIVYGLPTEQSLSMMLEAQASFKEVLMETKSVSLLKQGWPESIDLCSATADQKAKLTSLGFNVLGLWGNASQMALLDFSAVVRNIKAVADDNNTTFTVTVKDAIGRTTEPVTLAVLVEEVSMKLSAVTGKYYAPGENLEMSLVFNGDASAIKDNVLVECYDPVAGKFRPTEIVDVSPASRALAVYNIVIATPVVEGDLKVRATSGGLQSAVIEVPAVPYVVECNDADCYAHDVYFAVKGRGSVADPDASAVTMLSRKAGSNAEYTEAAAVAQGNLLHLTGLEAGTAYEVAAKVGDITTAAKTITTEAALQLPNAGFETWSKDNGATNYWWIDYPGADKANLVWDTMNLLTTSEGGSSTSAFDSNRNGCAYNAISGTQPTSDASEGSQAAAISTVGWGRGNGATGSSSTPNYLTVGELYLGKYENSDARYSGYAFGSRPVSVSFDAKYSPKNSADYGTAKVVVMDAQGVEIAANNVTIANTAYQTISLPLTYTPGVSKKAAKILVVFTSSGNAACLGKSNSNYSTPSFGNTSTGKFVGSTLTVDNVVLHY